MRRKKPSFLLADLSEEGDIDLTPLIDVVFVVLIMFILVAPMLDIDKIKLASGPQTEQHEQMIPKDNNPLVIHVREDNTILINKREIERDSLRPLLKALHLKDPKLIPQLYQDKKAYFGTYQTVKNAVEEAGFEELDVVLEPGR